VEKPVEKRALLTLGKAAVENSDGADAPRREDRCMADTKPDVRTTLASLIEAWRNGDALRAAAHFTLDGSYSESGRPPLAGRDALVAHFTRFFRDGPRWRFDVDDILIDESRACVVYRFAVEGTGHVWRERAGCAIVIFDPSGAIARWREYEG